MFIRREPSGTKTMKRRPPGLWMKKELKETNYTLDGCSALVSVPCVVPVLSLSTMQTPACPGVPVYSHQNIMCMSWDHAPQPRPNLKCPFLHTALLPYAFSALTPGFPFSSLPTPGSCPWFCPCSLLSGLLTLLPTTPQEPVSYTHLTPADE